MKSIITCLLMVIWFASEAQVTAINPTSAYQGQSIHATITSSSLFLSASSPQGNIQDIILKNATDSVFAISDSTNVVSANTATSFWNIPANLASGLYSLVVRVYNSLFSGPTTDYSLNNSFTVTAATSTVSGTVYNDLNHNGTRDAGEPGLPGYTVQLRHQGNQAVTDTGGHYTIGTIPGLDTIVLQQPLDDIYTTASRIILTVPVGATTGRDFSVVLYRYLTSMTPDTATVGQIVNASILSSDVFKNATINNISLRQSGTNNLIYGSASIVDTNHANASFNIYNTAGTGYYDLVVVVQSTQTNNLKTFTLDSAFRVFGPVGFISGYVFADSNGNGIKDPGEAGIQGQYIEISSPAYGFASVLSDTNGYYSFHTLPNGAYSVFVQNPYSYYGSCTGTGPAYSTPQTYAVTINRDTVSNEDFGQSGSTTSQYDLFIHPGWRPANPGFVRHYWIFYGNLGNVSATGGVITFQYDPTLTFDSCDRTPSSHDLVNHILTWNVGTVDPTPLGPWTTAPGGWYGGWNTFNLYMSVPVSDSSGRLLSSTFSISPTSNDCTLWNNVVQDITPVTSSMDPNEKHANPYNGLVTGQDSIVNYTINFQNTGTASTHFVIVKDTLDSHLDYRTVITTGGSGPFRIDNNAGALTFTFDPLILTDSASDEPHSHGFVSFMVKVKTGTPVGTVIHNTAAIYFDYNSAVRTNTTINSVINPLGFGNMKSAMNVSVHPNPFEESTVVSFSNPGRDKFTLTVYDLEGNEIKTMSGSDAQFLIAKDGMAPGVYMYKLTNQRTRLSAQGKVSVL